MVRIAKNTFSKNLVFFFFQIKGIIRTKITTIAIIIVTAEVICEINFLLHRCPILLYRAILKIRPPSKG